MAKKRKNKANHYPTKHGATSSAPPPPLPRVEAVAFNIRSENAEDRVRVSPPPYHAPEEADEGEWEVVESSKKSKREKYQKNRNYPEFVLSPQGLRRPVGINDLQNLVLWLSADGPSPQWLLVKHKPEIRRVVVLLVPGLTMDMFDGSLDLIPESPTGLAGEDDMLIQTSPDKEVDHGTRARLPVTLDRKKLAPCLQDMADMFPYIWPIRTIGDDKTNTMQSPVQTFLTCPLPKNAHITQAIPSDAKRMKVTQCLMALEDLVENEYPLHSLQLKQLRHDTGEEGTDGDENLPEQRKAEGWVETDLSKGNNGDKNQAGSITEGKTIYALDCEMCQTEDGLELARISVIDWDEQVVYDTLVKPTKPITDYLTAYSGITKEKLEKIATTLPDVQAHLLDLFNNDTILVGQSLNFDLLAMKFCHPHVIDTSCLYHHSRGPPYKASLKSLSRRFLKREIQNASAQIGHDSIEDSRACLDLLKLKLEKGARFGTSDGNRESIFQRLARPPHGPKKTAIIDFGNPQKMHGAHTTAIVCSTDCQVVAAIRGCVNGDAVNVLPATDFLWARFRELETARGFDCTNSSNIDIDGPLPEVEQDLPKEELAAKVTETVQRIKEVYEGLPKCTAFFVYSGTGDLRKWRCMHEIQRRFKKEYKVRNWGEVSVRWTDTEDQALRHSLSMARSGLGFMIVK